MEVHLWEAYNPKKISVEITKELKEKFWSLIKGKTYALSKEINLTTARFYDYFLHKKCPIPLHVLIKLSHLFNISLLDVEKNIIMYKHMFVPNKNSIKDPKLPLKISPYFTSIISHLYFDGSVPEDGKGTYYNQKDEKIMNDFISKVKKVFGDVQYSLARDHRGVLKCRIPRIIGEICKHIYRVDSFGTFDSRISKKIFNLSKEHKIAFILTAILDEGSITYDGQIFFGVSNKLLCEDIKKICNQIGLETNPVKRRLDSNHYYIYIKSLSKVSDYIHLFKKKYPLISLRYKEERLEYYFEIQKHPGLRTKKGGNDRKRRILSSLKEGDKTVNQLAKELLILPRSIRRHLDVLLIVGKISKDKKGKENYFTLTTPH